MKYYANYTANNGTSLKNPITDTNKKRIIQDIRDIANGETFEGNSCSWSVWVKNGDKEIEIASGGTCQNGRKYRTL